MATTITRAILNYKNQLAASVSSGEVLDMSPIEKATTAVVEKEEAKTTNSQAFNKGIVFKVQIAASSKMLALTKSNFKGLKGLSRQKSGNLYRYFYGEVKQYKAAERLKQKAVKAGYEHAFLVAFKDGVKINISDAISPK